MVHSEPEQLAEGWEEIQRNLFVNGILRSWSVWLARAILYEWVVYWEVTVRFNDLIILERKLLRKIRISIICQGLYHLQVRSNSMMKVVKKLGALKALKKEKDNLNNQWCRAQLYNQTKDIQILELPQCLKTTQT